VSETAHRPIMQCLHETIVATDRRGRVFVFTTGNWRSAIVATTMASCKQYITKLVSKIKLIYSYDENEKQTDRQTDTIWLTCGLDDSPSTLGRSGCSASDVRTSCTVPRVTLAPESVWTIVLVYLLTKHVYACLHVRSSSSLIDQNADTQ